MADINITIPLTDYDGVSFTPKPLFPPQVVTITNDPNPFRETGVTHPPVTRSVTLPPWPQDTIMYVPPRDSDDEDEYEDDSNKDDDNKDSDDDSHLPVIPVMMSPMAPEVQSALRIVLVLARIYFALASSAPAVTAAIAAIADLQTQLTPLLPQGLTVQVIRAMKKAHLVAANLLQLPTIGSHAKLRRAVQLQRHAPQLAAWSLLAAM